jgi:AraC-like DNA-binding protein
MKIMHEQLNIKNESSLKVKWDDFPHFTFPWHFHPEYELVYVIESFGTRFIGDSVENFEAGDLVLLGSNVPHFWKNNELFHRNDPQYKVKAVVIHFPEDFFKQQIDHDQEFQAISHLLKKAGRGIHFSTSVANRLQKDILKLLRLKGLRRTLHFVDLLDQLATTKNQRLLASESYQANLHDLSSDRLDKVMHFINSNYRQDLKVTMIAQHVSMNTSAFCRYFKNKTGKSVTEFVNEMRIGYACKLLLENKQNISQICFESGFNNLSNFNHCFKRMKSFSPSQYRKLYHLNSQVS